MSRIDIFWLQAMYWLWPSWKRFIPILVLVSFAGLIASYFNSKYSRQPFNQQPGNYLTRVKRVLFFTPFFKKADWDFGFGSEPFGECPSKNCFVTDEGEPEDFDAILFHARNLKDQVYYETKSTFSNDRFFPNIGS